MRAVRFERTAQIRWLRGVLLLVAVVFLMVGATPAVAGDVGPSGPTAIALASSVQVSWQAVSGATAYTVYRGTSASAITTAVTPPGGVAAPATSFTDTTAVNGTTYYYAVRAVVGGAESPNSLAVEATPVGRSCSSGNAVVLENCYPGATSWNVRNAAQVPTGIEGFATAQSVNAGGSVDLKVNSAAPFNVEIYRTGWYGGSEARLFSIVRGIPATPQPACSTPYDGTGLVDCANWSVSATISTTTAWPSGVYLLRLVRTDNSTDNAILLVVRNDGRHPDLIYGAGMTTFQAYNNYGGRSLYDFNSYGSVTVAGTPRAVKVSFDRPFEQPRSGLRDWYTNTEIATVAWLEQNGYDVAYVSDGDLETQPSLLLDAKAYVSPAHEEYVSGAMRSAMQQARDAGVSLFFTGSNEIYWKIRFESSPTTGASDRIEVCYKTIQGGVADPVTPTTTWRDPSGPNQPENALTGEMYIGDNDSVYFPLVVSAAEGQDRVYRYTGLDTQAPGTSTTIGQELVGWEWDARVSNGAEPPGVKTLSSSPVTGALVQGSGASYVTNQNATASMVKYTAASGALVVTTGTNHWNRGLARNPAGVGSPDLRIQQTTVNILEDMGVRPATPQAGIVLDPTSDTQPPTAPSNLQATGGSNQVALTWSASTDNVGVARYDVYRSTVSGFTPSASNRVAQPTGTSYTDTNLAPGTYYYRVAAEDAAGNVSGASNEASAAAGSDTTAPTVAITAPAAAATVSATVTITADAGDNVGVAGVQFKVDGANLGAEDITSPYSSSWDTTAVANGTHTITAVARDAAGNSTTSAPVSVTVSNAVPDTTPPTVAITAPANGSTVSGTVKINASASDAGSGVASVAFYVDGALLGTSTSAPYVTVWNTRKFTKGQHVLHAVATDKAGNVQQSASVTVTVG